MRINFVLLLFLIFWLAPHRRPIRKIKSGENLPKNCVDRIGEKRVKREKQTQTL